MTGSLYEALFEATGEAMLVVDGASGGIRAANKAASARLGASQAGLADSPFADMLGRPWRTLAKARLRGVLASGRPDGFVAAAAHGGASLSVSVEPLQGSPAGLLLVRLRSADTADTLASDTEAGLADLVRRASELVVLTDTERRILWANEAFLGAAQVAMAGHAVGRQFDEFLAPGPGARLAELFSTARREGRAELSQALLQGGAGAATPVRVSVVDMGEASPPGFGLILHVRDGDRLPALPPADLQQSVESLFALAGRAPLKDVVRDTTDTIERACIEAALRLTGNNRTAAARALGLSRQTFYLKLERYNIGDS